MKAAEIKEILRAQGIKLSKSSGQNFLVDERFADIAIGEAEIKRSEIIFEIGSGLGILTKKLAPISRTVIAIEKDGRLANILKQELAKEGVENVEITIGDALKIKWPIFDKCVSNIPYQISSRVIEKLAFAQKEKPRLAVIMLQKEFAQRLIAEAGEKNYSRITILARYFFTPVLITKVPPNAFWPQPDVESAIVKLYPRRMKPAVKDEKIFFTLARALFQHPNQKAAKAFVHSRHEFKMEKQKATDISKTMPHRDKRVFHLNIEEIADISNWIVDENILKKE